MDKNQMLGVTKEIEVMVREDMTARLGGHKIHPLLSSCSLIQEMEWVARLAIIDFLAQDEDAVGSKIKLKHLNATPVGMKIKVLAKIIYVHKNRVNCYVEAFNNHHKIGSGSIEQVIVKKKWLEQKINKLYNLIKGEELNDQNDGNLQKTS